MILLAFWGRAFGLPANPPLASALKTGLHFLLKMIHVAKQHPRFALLLHGLVFISQTFLIVSTLLSFPVNKQLTSQQETFWQRFRCKNPGRSRHLLEPLSGTRGTFPFLRLASSCHQALQNGGGCPAGLRPRSTSLAHKAPRGIWCQSVGGVASRIHPRTEKR